MECTDINVFADDDIIEPCRTCGIYFISNHAVIQPIFEISRTGDISNCMQDILDQLNAWNIEVERDDGRPQYMCIGCIREFQRLLNFKRSCLETQEQFNELEYKRVHNGVMIKKEVDPTHDVGKFCGYIYLDTDEDDGSEDDGSGRVCAPFDIPHVPIKEEHTARVPHDASFKPIAPIVTNLPNTTTFAQVKPELFSAANGFSSTPFESTPQSLSGQGGGNDGEGDVIKFTYDDDDDEVLVTLPTPIAQPGVFCKLCGHTSVTQEQHVEHMNRIHMVKDCECHICGKKFTNAHESRLRYHMKWHKLQKHLKCPTCGFFCNSKDTLREHKLAVHTRSKCEFCGKTMKRKQLQAHLTRHLKEHEEELARKVKEMESEAPPILELPNIIQCAFCQYTFHNLEELQIHVMATHRVPANDQKNLAVDPEQRPSIESRILGSQKELLTLDLNAAPKSINCSTHSGNSACPSKSLSECTICGKKFDLQIKLNRHINRHHSNLTKNISQN